MELNIQRRYEKRKMYWLKYHQLTIIAIEKRGFDNSLQMMKRTNQYTVNELKPNTYKDDEWRFFTDLSKNSIKAVLLHNRNVYTPIPIAHLIKLKKKYENLKIVLGKIKYSNHQWKVCGDIKIGMILLCQQSKFKKFPCFLYLWNTRDRKQQCAERMGFADNL